MSAEVAERPRPSVKWPFFHDDSAKVLNFGPGIHIAVKLNEHRTVIHAVKVQIKDEWLAIANRNTVEMSKEKYYMKRKIP